MPFSSIYPIIFLVADIFIVTICLRKISIQRYFNYFNRTKWMFLVVFHSFLGQFMYLVLELNNKLTINDTSITVI